MLKYSVAEVPCPHKPIRYLKAGKGTPYQQQLDLLGALQRRDATRIWVLLHGAHHISAALSPEDDEALQEYLQSPAFITERLVWTKQVFDAG
jgi:hypothetical protein